MMPTPFQQACLHTAAELLKYAVEKQRASAPGTPEYHVYAQAAYLLGALFHIVADNVSAMQREDP